MLQAHIQQHIASAPKAVVRPALPRSLGAPLLHAPRQNVRCPPVSAHQTKMANAPETLVQEALDGLVLTHPHLTRLDGYPDVSA